ncbi:EamA family transporter [Aquabacterium sp. OR-4]|uniref:EamA family transporter n=1 Tax=Aquabacterium sp. OR-4 TaxID=2978127 RepID=UPI0021B3F578|nr:EamA family transporter [Aquabacterium sp. OR-4]MDT7835106.1 EamA family transporter [Aquabacterium sp. OR-4]
MSSAALPRPTPLFTPLVLACLAATWLVWGSTYLAIKVALTGLPPFWQMGSRFLVAGALLMAWVRWRGTPWPTRREWAHAAIVGTLMLGAGMGGTAVAEQSVASGLVVAYIAVSPLMAALLNLGFGVRPRAAEWAGIGLGLAGVLLLVQGAGFAASPAGLAAQTIACAGWVLGSVLSQRKLPLAPGAAGFASEMLCGGLVLMLISLGVGEQVQLGQVSAAAWGAWLYLVVAGSLLAFNAYMLLLARVPTGLATSYAFVNPIIALLLGVGLAGEQVSGAEWAAAGVILGGVAMLLWARR